MGDAEKLRPSELAKHWGVSRAYVSKLRARDDWKDFSTFAEADTWRELHAPPANKRGGVVSKSAPGGSGKNDALRFASPPSSQKGVDGIDLSSFVSSSEDFDLLMIRHAEEVPQIAYGLYKEAAKWGDAVMVANQMRNWSEASKQAGAVRERFLDIKQRTGELLPLDVVQNIVGSTLGGLRGGLSRLAGRCARAANPDNPALAQQAIEKEVDRILEMARPAEERISRQLLSVAPEPSTIDDDESGASS